MARRFIVGILYCLVLYFTTLYVVAVTAANRVAVPPGENEAAVRSEAGNEAAKSNGPMTAIFVVAFVFFASRAGILPGTRPAKPAEAVR